MLAQSVIRVSWGPVVASQRQSGSIKTTLSQYGYKLVYFGTPFYFANISAPKNHTEMSLYSEFTYMDLSFSNKTKKGFEISFSVADIFHKQSNIVIIHFLWDTLYCQK